MNDFFLYTSKGIINRSAITSILPIEMEKDFVIVNLIDGSTLEIKDEEACALFLACRGLTIGHNDIIERIKINNTPY